jgi:type 1 glutamine amidotransferase
MRFLTLPPNQLAHISNYLASGKPIVALRTTTHAFDYPITDNRHSWNDFGRQVLGTAYYAHVGDHTDVTIAPKAGDHPILTGLPRTTTRMPSQLYTAVIPDDATPLLIGSTTGDRRVLVSQFGWTWFPPEPRYPIAWTWHTPAGAKVFTTTLGSVEDLEQPLARRLVINAIHWAVDLPAPRD